MILKKGWKFRQNIIGVPMIIINDNFVGGFDELNNLYSEGKLEELL